MDLLDCAKVAKGFGCELCIVANDLLQTGDESHDRGQLVHVNVAIADAKQIEELQEPNEIRELPVGHPDAIEETLSQLFVFVHDAESSVHCELIIFPTTFGTVPMGTSFGTRNHPVVIIELASPAARLAHVHHVDDALRAWTAVGNADEL